MRLYLRKILGISIFSILQLYVEFNNIVHFLEG